MSTRRYAILVIIIVISILSSFYSGFFFNDLISKPNNLRPYFSDEIILVTKDKPHYTLIAYASRSSKKDMSYYQSQKVFFFDSNSWQKKYIDIDSSESNIVNSGLIPKWEVIIDPTLVLKQAVNGEVQIGDNKIEFDVPQLNNELGIRSLEGYTIFRSEATGKLIINEKEYESYVLYSRTYSYSTSIDLIEVTDPLGINTDYLAFWDNEGNFYNIDKTSVDNNYKGEYKSHAIAVFKDNLGRVQKSFSFDIKKKLTTGYIVNILDGIDRSIDVNILNSTDKNEAFSPYIWTTGQIEGEVNLKNGKIIKGFGIYEQLYQ